MLAAFLSSVAPMANTSALKVTTDAANVMPPQSTAIQPRPTMVEVKPGVLYYAELTQPPRLDPQDGVQWFFIERFLHYISFSADFGPVNMSQLYRFTQLLRRCFETLDRSANAKIVCYTTPDEQKRANSVFLIAAYLVLVLKVPADEAFEPFRRAGMTFVPFRDAGGWPSLFNLTIPDCLRGLEKARDLGWVSLDKFNVDEYEFFEQVDNGDWNWIIPDKLLAFAGPQSSDFTYAGLAPEYYIPHFKRMGVTSVVRLNNKLYESSIFSDAGFEHREMFFPDGHNPSDQILYEFLDFARHKEGAIAVHCKAGLGRTGTLICAYMMRYYGFTAAEAIGFSRIQRPGMVVGPQQNYLLGIEPIMHGLPRSSPPATPSDAFVAQPRKAKDGHNLLQNADS